MTGPERRLIKQMGKDYTVKNASGGSGGRELPSYSGSNTVTAVLERRGMPKAETQSDGTEVETDLELRAIVPSGMTITPAGESSNAPTKLEHPNGTMYRVLATHEADSGVDVLTVMEDS